MQVLVAAILATAGVLMARFVRMEIMNRRRHAKRSILRQNARRRQIRMNSWSYQLPWDLMNHDGEETP